LTFQLTDLLVYHRDFITLNPTYDGYS